MVALTFEVPRRTRRHVCLGLAAAALMAAVPATAHAQTRRLFLPRAGALLPPGALGDAPVSTQIPGLPPESQRAELGTGALLGFGLVVDRGGPILLRADVDWAPHLPVRLDDRRSFYDGSMATITAGVMTRPGGSAWVRPYISAGAGFRSYRFQPWASAGPQMPDHRLDLALRLGAGAEVPIGPLTLTADALDFLSSFRFDEVQGAGGERTIQNDLAFLLGLRFTIH